MRLPRQKGPSAHGHEDRLVKPAETFGWAAAFCFYGVTGSCWPYALIVATAAIPLAGPTGTIVAYLAVGGALSLNALSLAELSSMAPRPSGQYGWISLFAPKKVERQASFTVGWLQIIGWNVGTASICVLAAQMIEAMIYLQNPMVFWHRGLTGLLTVVVAGLAYCINVYAYPILAGLEIAMVFLFFFGFIAFFILAWTMGPLAARHEVWMNFQNPNLWPSNGVATMVATQNMAIALISADSTVHMAREIKDPKRTLPQIMTAGYFINLVMGVAILLSYIAHMGDLEEASNNPSGWLHIGILLNITGSTSGTIVANVVLLILLVACATNAMATSSRQTWTFACNAGMPFARFFSYLWERPNWEGGIPKRVLGLSFGTCTVLAALFMGSVQAFNIIGSVFAIAVLSSYILGIGSVCYRRFFYPETIRDLNAPWSLGRFGLPINLASIGFNSFLAIMVRIAYLAQCPSLDLTSSKLCFPLVPNPSLAYMNWASVVLVAVMAFAILYWLLRGRHTYRSPAQMGDTGGDGPQGMSGDTEMSSQLVHVDKQSDDIRYRV
ncbi:hypothetical protein LTR37_005753 [Vermiconidia calcicola]|uniref:Uncharacterized protein n=1 Tax=Vermiconidia calcicola TaxID=1690605 RepID=A0ACC3NI11_9PEZI|nr:hypothetical protein LTR37_005753 [Vermiconidia calcicola]